MHLLTLLLYQMLYLFCIFTLSKHPDMSSIKLIFRKDKINKNNEIPLYVRIIKNRKTKLVSLGISLKEEQWDASSNSVVKHKNKVRLNNFIAQKIAEANKIAMEMEISNKYVSSNRIKEKILGNTSVSFSDYAKEYRDRFKLNKQIGTHRKTKAILKKLDDYVKGRNLSFGEIDIDFLKKYEKYLRTKMNNSTNTIHSNLKVIRKIFNDAVRDDLIDYQLNPFTKFQLKTEKTTKDYLTDKELDLIDKMELTEGTKKFHHRNAYIFAAYAGGIRVSDLLKLQWANFDGIHITFQMKKTKDTVSVKLPKKALSILDYYAELSPDKTPNHYIFPFLNNSVEYDAESLHIAISRCTAYLNKDLNPT